MKQVIKMLTNKIESEVCEGLLERYTRTSKRENQLLMQRLRLEMRRKFCPKSPKVWNNIPKVLIRTNSVDTKKRTLDQHWVSEKFKTSF